MFGFVGLVGIDWRVWFERFVFHCPIHFNLICVPKSVEVFTEGNVGLEVGHAVQRKTLIGPMSHKDMILQP